MKEYRLYFSDNTGENVERTVQKIASDYTPGYTLLNVLGVWKSQSEEAYCLVIVEDDRFIDHARAIAERLRVAFEQECVLLTVHTVEVELI